MKKILAFIVSLACLPVFAANVRIYFAQPYSTNLDTNAIVVQQIGTNILANGGVVPIGLPVRIQPASTGYATNYFSQGWYSVSNTDGGGKIVINVWDSGPTLYDLTNVLQSGFNTYVVVQYGTNLPPSFNAITNALGFLPASLTNVTNITLAVADTNGAAIAAASISTNGLGTAAFVPRGTFDAAGTALAATNGLGASAFVATSAFDTNNAGIAAAKAATNGLGTAAFTLSSAYDANGTAQNTTNHLGTAAFTSSTAYDSSGTGAAAAMAATNGLGSAAFKSGSTFDSSGAAIAATNGLGSAAFANTTAFDTNNAGTSAAKIATNSLGSAAFTAGSAYDSSGAAAAATNRLGTAAFTASSAYDASGSGTTAAAAATNGLGSAAFKSSGSFDASGAALAATNGLQSAAFVPSTDFDTNNAGIAAAKAATNGLTSSAFYTFGPGTSVTFSTNGSAVTISSTASGGTGGIAVQSGAGNANTFTNPTLLGSITVTNLDARYDAAGSANTASNAAFSAVVAATNALGTSAFKSASAFDAANAALSATNGLGSAAFTAASAYDASGAALNSTNHLGNTIPTSQTNTLNAYTGSFTGNGSGLYGLSSNSINGTVANAYNAIAALSSQTALAANTATNTSGTGTAMQTNENRVVTITNGADSFSGSFNGNFNEGAMLVITNGSTNYIGTYGGVDANGSWILSTANNWPNTTNSTYNGILSGGTLYLQSNSISLYSAPWNTLYNATTPVLMSQVNGALPAPYVRFGAVIDGNGLYLKGNPKIPWVEQEISTASNNLQASQSAVATNAAQGVVSNLTILTNTFSATKGGPIYSGDSAGWAGKTSYGQPWLASQIPWQMIYVDPTIGGLSGTGNGEGESYITNMVNIVSTNGTLSILTNAGYQPGIYLDVGWTGARVPANDWPFIVTNWGTMTWNTNLYPTMGLPGLIAWLHGKGFKVMGQLYYSTNITPATADMILDYPCGCQGQVPYTNGIGAWPSNQTYGGQAVIVSTPDTAVGDMSEMYCLGFDGVSLSDDVSGINTDPFNRTADIYGNAVQTVLVPTGWYNAVPFPGYKNVNTGVFSFNYTNQFQSIPALYMMRKMLFVSVYETPYEAGDNENFTDANRHMGAHAGIFWENSHQIGSGDFSLREICQTNLPATRYANQGAYVLWLYNSSGAPSWGQKDEASVALTHAFFMGGFTNEVDGYTSNTWAGWAACVTNPSWMRIENDQLQKFPTMAVDYGTNGSVWKTELTQGQIAVGMFNAATYTTNITVTWAQLGVPTNQTYAVQSVLGASGALVSTNTGSLTETGYTAGYADLFLLTPLKYLQDAGPLYLENSNSVMIVDRNLGLNNALLVPEASYASVGKGSPGGGYTYENAFQLSDSANGQYGAIFGDLSYYNGDFDYGAYLGYWNNQQRLLGVFVDEHTNTFVYGPLLLGTNTFSKVTNALSMEGTSIPPGFCGLAVSNGYDLWWITPTATNRVALGH